MKWLNGDWLNSYQLQVTNYKSRKGSTMKNFIIKFGWHGHSFDCAQDRLGHVFTGWKPVPQLLLLLAFVCLTCAITIAEVGVESAVEQTAEPNAEPAVEQTAEPAAEPNAEPPAETEGETILPLKERMQKRISVEFRNTAIEDALMLMADQADVDIVKSPSVTGNVTVKLTNVPLNEALDNILAAHGYRYVADRNMIRVAPADEIAQVAERIITRIYTITYADVKEVESALRKVLSKQGTLSSNLGTSNIIVTDVESQIKAIDEFVEVIDRMTPQILVEARIYDVTSTEGFDIGAEWHMSRNIPMTDVTENKTHSRTDTETSGTHTVEQTVTVTDIVDTVDPTNSGTVTKTETKTMDKPGPITSYGITDTDGTTEESLNSWWKDKTTGEYIPYRKSKPFVGGSFDTDVGGTIRLGFLDMVDMELALSILRTQVGAKLLANPRILVLDNETAEFKIISEIPYTEQSSTSAGGSMTSTQFKEVGVVLKVTPHLTRDGMVRLHIMPEFSVVSELGAIVANSGGARGVPTVDARKVDTKALIKDGQTVVLGGLRKREVTQNISKVPLLGDIPVLGSMFSDVSDSVKTNELIIFITPRIITEPTLSAGESKGLEATEFGGPKVINTGDEKAEKSEK